VVANDEALQSDKVFINVGGRASVPEMPGIHDVPFLTNSSMMDVDFLPEHLVIVGGSYVGLEFGQMYRRFGSEVTIVEMGPRLIGREDEDVSEAVREILEIEAIRVTRMRNVYHWRNATTVSPSASNATKVRRTYQALMFFWR
jgi:pyruvate/2-oxoglutarate dehydrogenase complex dihydrolipoamide dehydrogenase (E3) component